MIKIQSRYARDAKINKKGNSEKKEKTYSVTVSYFTYEIDERLGYVASKFGRRLNESTSELLCDVLSFCKYMRRSKSKFDVHQMDVCDCPSPRTCLQSKKSDAE